MKIWTFPAFRPSTDERKRTFAVVTASAEDHIKSIDDLLVAIRDSVNRWLQKTERGRLYYAESCQFTLQNLHAVLGQPANYCSGLWVELLEHGIKYLEVIVYRDVDMTPHDWTFDTSLCDDRDAMRAARFHPEHR